jgi:dihydrofolate reductase
MARLVATEFITLDGVFEDPGGGESFDLGGWAFNYDRGEEGNRFKYEELMAADAQLLGRTTYNGFARAWPNMAADDFGQKMNAMPKHVVTSTPLDPAWENSSVLDPGDLAAGVRELKGRYRGDLLVAGSGRLVRSLLDLGLVDELRLMVYPTVLGRGQRLFDGVRPAGLRMTGTRQAGETTILTLETAAGA